MSLGKAKWAYNSASGKIVLNKIDRIADNNPFTKCACR